MKYYQWLFCCAVLMPIIAHADIKINEVAWMGTAASQYSEWIELYNDGQQAVSLDGWKLYKTDNTLLFTLTKKISANGYLLIERTTTSAPDAVPGINDESGTFGGGGLRNTGEDLTLTDKEGTVIDSVPYSSGWPAGDSKTKDTMQWTGSKWITAPGTPDAKNATDTTTSSSTDTSTDSNPSTSSGQVPSSQDTSVQTPATQTVTVQTPVVAPVTTTPASTQTTTTTPVVTTFPSSNSAITQKQTPEVTTPAAVSTAPTIGQKIPVAVVAPKKSSGKKSVSTISSVSPDSLEADALNADADQTTGTPQENNHTKIIIFGAVILIGMALFLLLQRFKARQE